VFAVEDLIEFQTSPYLYANKFIPDQDFGGISCWLENLHNRTHLDRDLNRLKSSIYLNLPQVFTFGIYVKPLFDFRLDTIETGQDSDQNLIRPSLIARLVLLKISYLLYCVKCK
jgi:hypothetical protein